MLFQVPDSPAFADEIKPHVSKEPSAAILRECLTFTPTLPKRLEPARARELDEHSRLVERLKMYRPGEAAQMAERWLREKLSQARQTLGDEEAIRRFCSALSTWGAVQRHLGQASDAAQAQLDEAWVSPFFQSTVTAG